MSLAKTIIIKSNMNCNLRCRYCYEFNRNGEVYNKKVMTSKQICAFIERTARLCPDSRILWMLHGGEPLINSIDYFSDFVSCIRRMNELYNVDFKIALQTNATLLTEEWIDALEKNIDLLSERIVSVSIDGPQEINDTVRITSQGGSSFDQVLSAIERIKTSKLTYTTISVVGSHNVDKPDEIYRFIKDLGPNLCKFIPCYNYNSSGETEKFGITPIQYSEFMCRIFDLWMHDLPKHSGKDWFVIDPIATIVSNLSDIFVTWCEYRKEKCDNFICLYPDGEMWLCDTFNHDSMRGNAYIGNIFTEDDDKLKLALSDSCNCCQYDKFYDDTVKQCRKCDIYKYCNGGCLPTRVDMKNKSEKLFDEYCKAKHILINYIREGVKLALS